MCRAGATALAWAVRCCPAQLFHHSPPLGLVKARRGAEQRQDHMPLQPLGRFWSICISSRG